jgi:hypothetical protein
MLRKLVKYGVFAAGVALLVHQYPDIVRYLKMKQM